MSYNIRLATREDIDTLVGMTVDLAVETENRQLDPARLAKGMHTAFDRPNLAVYYLVEFTPEDPPVVEGSPAGGASDSDGRGEARSGVAATASQSHTFPTTTSTTSLVPSPVKAPQPQRVAFMMATTDNKMRTATTLWLIQSTYVRPEHRGQGLFGRFYAHVKEMAMKDPECDGIWLCVEHGNDAARRVYEGLGMRRQNVNTMLWSKCGF